MKYLILYAHACDDKQGQILLDSVSKVLEKDNATFDVRDLNKIVPANHSNDSCSYEQHPYDMSFSTEFQEERNHLAAADRIIILSPYIGNQFPVILNKYFEKVFNQSFIMDLIEGGLHGLKGKKKVAMVNTVGTDPLMYKKGFFSDQSRYDYKELMKTFHSDLEFRNMVPMNCDEKTLNEHIANIEQNIDTLENKSSFYL